MFRAGRLQGSASSSPAHKTEKTGPVGLKGLGYPPAWLHSPPQRGPRPYMGHFLLLKLHFRSRIQRSPPTAQTDARDEARWALVQRRSRAQDHACHRPPHGLLQPTTLQHSTFPSSSGSEKARLCSLIDLDSVPWGRKSRQNHTHFADEETGQERPRLTPKAGESRAGMQLSAWGRGRPLHSLSRPKGKDILGQGGDGLRPPA